MGEDEVSASLIYIRIKFLTRRRDIALVPPPPPPPPPQIPEQFTSRGIGKDQPQPQSPFRSLSALRPRDTTKATKQVPIPPKTTIKVFRQSCGAAAAPWKMSRDIYGGQAETNATAFQ